MRFIFQRPDLPRGPAFGRETLRGLRRAGPWMLLLLALCFLTYRWAMRREPLNSDDLTLFTSSEWAAEGNHWVNGPKPNPPTNHQALRIGLFPVSVPLIEWLGAGAAAYYAVPLLFAFAGFLLVYLVIHRAISSILALGFATLHIVLPFEVMDSSRFLVDLPTALTSLLGLLLIGLAGRQEGRRSVVALGAAGGLAILWTYLLRANGPALLVPALGLFILHRRTRLATLTAGATLAAGVLAETGLYLARGLGWGFRWRLLDASLGGFSPFLPTFTYREFLPRGFDFLWERFDGGATGTFAVGFYLLALVAHVLVLFQRRRPILQAVALAGLTNWGVFSFAVFELVDGGVRAMAPSAFRYFQLFFYTSLICVAWLAARIIDRARTADRGDFSLRRRLASIAVTLLLAAAVGLSAYTSHRFVGDRIEDDCSDLRTVLCALDQLAAESGVEEALPVLVDRHSIRLLRLFRDESTRPAVAWAPLDIADLAAQVAGDTSRPVLVDHVRLAGMRRYWDDRTNEQLDTAQGLLREDFSLWLENDRFSLYRAGERVGHPLPLPNREVSAVGDELPGWLVTEPGSWSVSPDGELRIEGLPFDALKAVYLYSGSPPDFGTPPAPGEGYGIEGSGTYEVWADVGVPDGVVSSIFFIQFDETGRIARPSFRIYDGMNRVTLKPEPGATSYRLALRFANRDEAPLMEVPEVRSVDMLLETKTSSCACDG